MAFKLSAITWSHHYSVETGKLNDMKLIDLYAKEGMGGIEFIMEHIKKHDKKHLLRLKKRAADRGLSITAVSPGNSFGQKTDKGERAQIRYVKKGIDMAEILGCANVRVFAGWPYKRTPKYWKKAVRSMRECAKYAAERGITLAVEPHNGGGFLPDAKSTIKFLKDVNSPWVTLNLDTGNYLGHEKNIYRALERTVKYATYCHLKVHKISKSGKTSDFNLDRVVRVLSKGDYRGWLAIEYEGQEFIKGSKSKRAANEKEYFKIAVKKIKKLIKKYY